MNQSAGKLSIVLLALVVLGTTGNNQQQKNSEIRLAGIVGEITHRFSSTSEWRKATVNSELNSGGAIRTGTKSLAVISFGVVSKIIVRENTTIIIQREQKDSTDGLFIEAGRISFTFSARNDGRYRCSTPLFDARVSTEGGGGDVSYDSEKEVARIAFTGESIELRSKRTGETRMLPAGKQAVIDREGRIVIAK